MTAKQPPSAGSRVRRVSVPAFVLRRPTLTAAAVCLVSFTAFWAAQRALNVSMVDLMVYRAEGWTVRNGEDLYAMRATEWQLPNTYPPFAAILFVPLTWLGVPEMRTAATAVNLGLLIALVHLSLRLIDRPRRRLPQGAAAFAVASVAVWCEPVWTTLRYGQINLLLAVLVLWDFTRRPGHRWAGVGIGVATGIKLTPALFAVLLALAGAVQAGRELAALRGRPGAVRQAGAGGALWNHRLRSAVVACGAFLATAVSAAVLLPQDSRRFWTETLYAVGRPGHAEQVANQSLRGVLSRALHTDDPGAWWVLAAAAALVVGLAAATAAALAGARLPNGQGWAVVGCALTALLVSPVSWSHHWVWCVPAVLLLGAEARRRKSRAWRTAATAAGLAFCSYLIWLVPHGPSRPELHLRPGEMLPAALYPLVGSALLALTAYLAARAPRGRQQPSGRSVVEPAGSTTQ